MRFSSCSFWKLPLSVLLLLATRLLCQSREVYYITPNEVHPCHITSEPCHTLNYYANRLLSFPNQTVMYFLPGRHTLSGNHTLFFFEIDNLTLTGSELVVSTSSAIPFEPPSEVVCSSEGQAGFAFSLVKNLLIANLTFTSCGITVTNITAALFLLYDTNFTVLHTVIQNSTEFGMVVLMGASGSAVITNSAFFYNGRSSDNIGGGINLLTLPNTENGKVSISIDSSVFLYGDPVGVAIHGYYPCFPVHININNSKFASNGKWPETRLSIGSHFILGIFYSGQCRIHNTIIMITNSHFLDGTSQAFGGGAYISISENTYPYPCNSMHTLVHRHIVLALVNNIFQDNNALNGIGGGLMINTAEVCQSYHTIELNNVTFSNNSGALAGNMAIIRQQRSTLHSFSVKVNNCMFLFGKVTYSASVFLFISSVGSIEAYNYDSSSGFTSIDIADSKFASNHGTYGGALVIHTGNTIYPPFRIIIHNSSFINNSNPAIYITPAPGGPQSSSSVQLSCLHLCDNYVQMLASPNYNFSANLPYGSATNWRPLLVNVIKIPESTERSLLPHSAVTYLGNVNATFINCTFINNTSTGLETLNSVLSFVGNTTFRGNIEHSNGGGMLLRESYMLLDRNVQLYFIDNHASYGGAIYIVPMAQGDCFFELKSFGTQNQEVDAVIQFENNTANLGGDVLYGGNVDTCLLHQTPYHSRNDLGRFQWLLADPEQILLGSELFNLSFNYSDQSGFSVISSDPKAVCLCDSVEPRCSIKSIKLQVVPGEPFAVLAVLVGQRNGVTPGTVYAYPQNMHFVGHSQREHSQPAFTNCSTLTFTVASQNSSGTITLSSSPTYSSYPRLEVSLLPCPLGFTLSNDTDRCECAFPLDEHNFNCSIASRTIHRPGNVWIGYYYFNFDEPSNTTNTTSAGGVLLHMHCPLNYCKSEDIELNLEFPDQQCAFNHSGILCGACQSELSLTLGTSRCLPCSNGYVTLIFAFAIAGVALVTLLIACNLTISQGTLSGLIFYANIIHINHPIFFPSHEGNILTVFIAWLNLDLGIETCFHHGMNMYEKAWLQFIFPAYVWLVTFVIMILSYYFITATRIFGRQAVKVLATLFLLAYAKLLRTIITVLSYTSMNYPDHFRRFLWLYDGNIMYFHSKHIPLALAAILVFLIFVVPYVLILLFGQCLQRKHHWILSWVDKIKPFLDAYAGPCKDKYRFWTGLLLLARIVLFLVFAFNVQGTPALNILSITLISSLLFGTVLFCEVYESTLLNLLESFFLLNIICTSVATLYIQAVGGSQVAVSYTSASVAFAAFISIFAYHGMTTISTSRVWQLVSAKYTRARHPPTNDQETVSLSQLPEDTDNRLQVSGYDEDVVSHPSVQRLRLEFNTEEEAVLVVDESQV